MRAAVTGAPTIGLMAAACFAAALPYGAEAQAAAPVDLPGLEVESPTPADCAGVTGAGARAAVDATASAAGANPYADPSAPWEVDASANSMPRQPLVDTPRTVTAIPKEVLAAKNATSICALAVSWRAPPRA
jgi:outer membrane receptor for monomeric catechols